MDKHFLARFENRPALLAPAAKGRLLAAASGLEAFTAGKDNWGKPYDVTNGVLQVPVSGILLHDFPYSLGFATGYDYIESAITRGMSDPKVNGIALMVNSPGGEVAGAFDAADRIHAMRGQKPMEAFLNEDAYSAAYLIASTADKITAPRTGGAGSIGVVMMHVDMSGMLEDMGIKITPIFAGDHKVDGNPYEPLSDEARAQFQAQVDESYGFFVDFVARNRGMSTQAVRATQAAAYTAQQAADAGLIDEVAPISKALGSFSAAARSRRVGAMIASLSKAAPPAPATPIVTPAATAAATEAPKPAYDPSGARLRHNVRLASGRTKPPLTPAARGRPWIT